MRKQFRGALTVLLHDLEELNNHFRHGANQNLALSALFGVVHGLQEERRPRISKKTLKKCKFPYCRKRRAIDKRR